MKSFNLQEKMKGVYSDALGWQGDDADFISVTNPSDGTEIARVASASHDSIESFISQAQSGFNVWSTIPAPKRGEMIRLLANAFREHKEDLANLISLEMGKIKAESLGEVQEMIDIADFAVTLSRQLYGLTMTSERLQHRMYEQWLPLSPVLVITAFNFPVAVWAWNAMIAAVCGNTVIWKPSGKTPLVAIAIQHIVNEVMKTSDAKNVFSLCITENKALLQQLVDSPIFRLVSFTGSTPVGKVIAERVAKRLGRSLLELGGNNAVIVDDSANLNLAIPAIVFGAVGTAGQRCTSIRRLIVHHTKMDAVKAKLLAAYQQIKIGDPLQADVLMGPLIDAQAVALYQQTIQDIMRLGGKILCGGHTLKQAGNFVMPTLVEVKPDFPLLLEERFVPIVYVLPYQDLTQAIALQNAAHHGLSSALFTNRLRDAEQFLSSQGSDCGIANINIGPSGAEIGGAFGGEKDTGGGREAGSDAWKAYMRRQTVTVNWGDTLPLAQGIRFDIS